MSEEWQAMTSETSPLVAHAEYELRRAGLFDADADYGGTLAPHVLDLIRLFATGGPTGFSAPLTVELFSKLAMFQPLTPLTADPEEWLDRSEISGSPLWQNRRHPAAFSTDGGRSWYVIDNQGNRIENGGAA